MNDRDIAKQILRSAVVAAIMTNPAQITTFLDRLAQDLAFKMQKDTEAFKDVLAFFDEAAQEANAEILAMSAPAETIDLTKEEVKGNG